MRTLTESMLAGLHLAAPPARPPLQRFMSEANGSSANCRDLVDVQSGNATYSAMMFAAGVLGNVAALVLLELRRGRSGASVYRVLVTALLLTDMLGTVSVSPVVLSAYGRRRTLVGMSTGASELCSYFGFSMTFLSLSTLAVLCALALERYFSICHPYFYERRLSKRCGYVAVTLIYLGSVLFCVGPLVGAGKYVQYCPGTWCFLEMRRGDRTDNLHIGFYATFMLVVTSSTVICNIAVISHLVAMYKRSKARRGAAFARSRYRRSMSMAEEVDHLLPLAIITVVFICCTSPLVLQVYMNIMAVTEKDDLANLRALRLLSFHSIINPWVFIILRPSALKALWRRLRWRRESGQAAEGGGASCCAVPGAERRNEDDSG